MPVGLAHDGRAAPRVAVVLAVLGGVLHGACFAPLGIWPLAFVALGPLVLSVRGRSAAAGAGLGWLAGTVAATLAVAPWIMPATQDYFHQGPLSAALFATVVGQVFSALPTAAFGAVVPRLLRLRLVPLRILAVGAAWTALELVRSRALTGAPWDLLAHALYAHPVWIQVADVGGAFAVSFVLAVCGAAAAEAVAGGRGRALVALGTAAALLAGTAAYGRFRLATALDDGPVVRVALVQGSVPNAWRTDPARADDAFLAFAQATGPALAQHPDLVVWSENAVSFLLAPNPRFARAVAALLGPDGPPLVLGGPRYAQAEPGRVDFFNSAYLLGADGALLGFYDKRHLVPFAEYAPWLRLPGLGWRFDAPGGYTPGGAPTVFTRPDRFGILICFEVIYPGLARDLVRGGARFLLNLSNDAWFGTSAGLEQHFAMSVFRAVETRRALARATNTGVTALVAPSGRIAERFRAQVRGAWIVRVPARDGLTPYTRIGDVFAWSLAIGALAGLLLAPSRLGD